MSRCRFGLFEFDLGTGELRREGEIVKLAPQPTRVLMLLLERPGELILREQLKDRIWGQDTFVDFERGLNFCILQVRSALGDVPDNPRFVQTVPRKGYRFIAPVDAGPSAAQALLTKGTGPSTDTSAATTEAVVRTKAGRWFVAAAILAVVVLVAAVTVGGRRAASVTTPDRIRIAVLPFLNLTGDATLDYIGDGLTDELISQLGQLGRNRVSVIARTSAMTYRTSSKTASQIGGELGVGYIVESSLRRQSDGLRIATNLIRVSDGTSASSWSETFNPRSSPDHVQHTRATVRLARLIALELAPGAVADRGAYSIDPIAWDAFLKGKALTNSGSTADARQALVLFETAVKQQATFAAAWAKVAETRHLLVMMGGLAPGDAYAAAEVAARHAVQHDPDLADAHLALGLVQLWHEWRPALAAQSFEKALSLNPSLAAAHHDYAWSLVALGRNTEAVRHITNARALDPLSTRANNDVGWLYLQLGEPDEASRACEHTLAIQAGSLEAQACLERAHVLRDAPEAALVAAKTTIPASGPILPNTGDSKEALRAIWRWRLNQLEEASQTRWVSPYTLATLRVALGDIEQAVALVEEAYDDRVGMLVLLDRDPALAPIRHSPRIQALIERIRQPQSQE